MEWIRVKDKLPPNEEVVFVFNKYDKINLGAFIEKKGWVTFYEWEPKASPTHWMPLPEEPELDGYCDECKNEMIACVCM